MIKHDIIWFVVFKIWKIAVIFGRQWPYCRKYNNCQTLINMIRDVFVSCSCVAFSNKEFCGKEMK